MKWFKRLWERIVEARAEQFRRQIDYEVKRLRLEPGDILVLTTPTSLSLTQVNTIKSGMEHLLKEFGTKCIVLMDGMGIEVASVSAQGASSPGARVLK